ncbi:hypothetical protein FHG87_019756 [Trinorchestia longiramus]|nr:hypothetical protein FHG87_019756 [Trinorchestia longiramus]
MTTTINDRCGVDVENIDNMSFEELRRRARQLEGDIDAKLVAFSKLASSYGSHKSPSPNSDATPLLSSDDQYEMLSGEITQLLSALAEVNERLSNCSPGSAVAHLHTVQRHRDILQDYRNEFQRTSSTIKSRRERDQLLGSGNGRKNGSLAGVSRRDFYLKESEHLHSSDRMVDEQISIAVETRDHMKSQREAFKLIQTKVNDLSNRFPMLNTLMNKINLRKRRDSIVLGLVIGLCLAFMLWWIFF